MNAVSRPFNLFNFDNYGHPSMVYFFILGLGQYLDFGNMSLLYLTNAILYTSAIIAFWGILTEIFRGEKYKKEIFTVTFLFSFYPITLANTFQTMPDFGVFIFYVLFLYFFLRQQTLYAVLVSIGLIFSKEYGLLLYLVAIICDFGFHLWEKKPDAGRLLYLIPLVLFALRIAVKTLFLHQDAYWGHIDPSHPLLFDKTFPPLVLARIPLSYFSVIFILNFNWILTIFIFAGFVFLLWRLLTRKAFVSDEVQIRKIGFVMCLFGGSSFLLTIFKTFTNPRYFMPLYPLMIILFYFGLITVVKNNGTRKIVLITAALLFFISNFRTIDPISEKIYGTFQFGRHKILKMTSITGECCGYGRDQLVYNLEYTQFHFLLDKILTDIRPDAHTVLAYHPLEGLYIIPRISGSYKRTMKINDTFKPLLSGEYGFMPDTNFPGQIVFTFDDLAVKPETLYYIEFPNVDNRDALSMFWRYYSTAEAKIYENLGYQLKVDVMELKK